MRRTLALSFPIPNDYVRRFIFRDGNFEERLTVDCNGMHMEAMDDQPYSARTHSLCLDWLAECVMDVRHELDPTIKDKI